MDAARLKAWMTEKRWTVAALARELDVHPATIQRWRNGSKIPRSVELAVEHLDHTR